MYVFRRETGKPCRAHIFTLISVYLILALYYTPVQTMTSMSMIQKNPQFAQTWPDGPNGIAYLVGRLDHILNRRVRECVAQHGITAAQYTGLSVLHLHGQLSNAQLAERSMVSPQSANEMVKSMQSKGWVERESDSTHGRIIHLRLTPAGRDLLAQCDRAIVQVEQAMLAELSDAQQAVLHTQLRSMVKGLSQFER